MTPRGAPAGDPGHRPEHDHQEQQPMTHPVARRAVAHLGTIRARWGELLVAVETPPADVWPPRQLAHTLRPDGDDEPLDVLDRAPLVLRPHPAPANLDALDTRLDVERALYDLADTLAAAVQHAELGDPRRWQLPTEHTPGSRAYGPHWACVWVEGRVLDEDTTPEQQLDSDEQLAAPFAPLPEHLLREAADVAARAAGRVLRALGLDDRADRIPDRPCPWCAGELTLHTTPDGPPSVTCGTGPSCTAPVPLDVRGHRRRWGWRELPALRAALDAAERRAMARTS
jgi:hypothetical protein